MNKVYNLMLNYRNEYQRNREALKRMKECTKIHLRNVKDFNYYCDNSQIMLELIFESTTISIDANNILYSSKIEITNPFSFLENMNKIKSSLARNKLKVETDNIVFIANNETISIIDLIELKEITYNYVNDYFILNKNVTVLELICLLNKQLPETLSIICDALRVDNKDLIISLRTIRESDIINIEEKGNVLRLIL